MGDLETLVCQEVTQKRVGKTQIRSGALPSIHPALWPCLVHQVKVLASAHLVPTQAVLFHIAVLIVLAFRRAHLLLTW